MNEPKIDRNGKVQFQASEFTAFCCKIGRIWWLQFPLSLKEMDTGNQLEYKCFIKPRGTNMSPSNVVLKILWSYTEKHASS